MRPPHLNVPRPPLHLGPDHVRAGADEPEHDEKSHEEQELGLAPGVHDRAVIEARDAGEEHRGAA